MVVEQKPKRNHHHVWQEYLRAWSIDGSIWCYQDGRSFPTGTPRIAMQKDFYKLRGLVPKDIDLIRALFADSSPFLKKLHADFLNSLMAPFQVIEGVNGLLSPQASRKLIDEYSSNILEDYHTYIEATFAPSLKCALRGDISFYGDERCIPFLHYLCTQYMRTRGIKERAIDLCNSDKSADLSRVWNILLHMFAVNIAFDLFRDRGRRKLVLLRNCSEISFVTGDQPAINLKVDAFSEPQNLSIYYPISPSLALLLGDVDEQLPFASEKLTAAQALAFNERMLRASYKQLFAQSEESLKVLRLG